MSLSLWSSSESDSDSDLEDLRQLSEWTDDENVARQRPARCIRRVNYMQSLDDAEFTYRCTAFESLLTEIAPQLKVTSSRNHGVSALHQLLLSLRFYALGTMLISVADYIGVSQSSASRIVQDVSLAIAALYDRYVYVHQESAEKFCRIAGFPRVLGAIDGTHIRIQSPGHLDGEEYRNRKGYFSINVQCVCDGNLRLMNVVARWPGSSHDATIFNNSILRAQCESGLFGNRWLLGDSAYPNRPYLLTPLLNPVTEAEQRYNQAYIKTRNTIERTIGVWKRRFPVIALTLRLSLYNILTVIIATGVLHNICRSFNLSEVPTEVEFPNDDDEDDDAQIAGLEDITQRAELINNYFS